MTRNYRQPMKVRGGATLTLAESYSVDIPYRLPYIVCEMGLRFISTAVATAGVPPRVARD